MKLTKILICGALIGTIAFAASQASAFPLKLNSLSGTISATPSYSDISTSGGPTTNKTHFVTKSFNLKTVMMLVSNTLAFYGSNTPPVGSYIVHDPYTFTTYVTNSSGYYQNLSSSGMGYHNVYFVMDIQDIATSFTGNSNSGSENDKVAVSCYFYLIGPDGGKYYAGADYGQGTLHYSVNSKKASMTINGNGSDYGEINSSDDGSSKLSFVFSGSAASAEWDGPYSTFWWWD